MSERAIDWSCPACGAPAHDVAPDYDPITYVPDVSVGATVCASCPSGHRWFQRFAQDKQGRTVCLEKRLAP